MRKVHLLTLQHLTPRPERIRIPEVAVHFGAFSAEVAQELAQPPQGPIAPYL
jgi:hypothetical protein